MNVRAAMLDLFIVAKKNVDRGCGEFSEAKGMN